MVIAIATLLHILVLVYWLGGDLGAFYGSSFLADPTRTVPERMLALKILNAVDMAPRTALIMTLPTGVLLGWTKGWLDVPGWVPIVTAVASGVWLLTAWRVHLSHGTSVGYRQLDIAIRWTLLATLLGLASAGLTGTIALPAFIAGKLIVLAACIALGLLVRRLLVPLAEPVRAMTASGPTTASDAAISRVLANTRPAVLAIWALLLVATYLGVATPV